MRKDIIYKLINNHSLPGYQRKMVRTSIQSIEITPKPTEILFITSYPPRECGIATYSQDLIRSLNVKFDKSFKIRICPLESKTERHIYTDEIKYVLNTDFPESFSWLSKSINKNVDIGMVMIQHEFGFFNETKVEFIKFLKEIRRPLILVFHTVLPRPNELLKSEVQQMAGNVATLIVMTKSSANILIEDYDIPATKISIIPHGTHLVQHVNKEILKEKYQFSGRKILSTFGLLSSGKSIETTLLALPEIIKQNPDVLFLIIGRTHPSVVKHEAEKYRNKLEAKVEELGIQHFVKFINYFLPLPVLLEYLQLTDIYLFTSNDPNQAVSGTFSYAISCGCPIISTPIPHAKEVLQGDAGIIIDFEEPGQLGPAVTKLLNDDKLRKEISSNGLHRMASTAWENAAIAHAILFENISDTKITLNYNLPELNFDHLKKMTTPFGMIQFSELNTPDIQSGYTLDDNARALIAICQHYELTSDKCDLYFIDLYFKFIKYCQQQEGYFLNYVDKDKKFTAQNNQTNLADANGRAIWALGYLISFEAILPKELIQEAEMVFENSMSSLNNMHSTRALAFAIKGLYYRNSVNQTPKYITLIKVLADRLVQMYRHEADDEWQWFESYLTYANSILPEALLCAWFATGESVYKEIALSSLKFLLSKTFINDGFKVISNKSWMRKNEKVFSEMLGGQQPIDVSYTIMALAKFYHEFKDDEYMQKLKTAFNWFLGNNHLHQVIYNPCTGGCYDGLEESYVNLNQGAESTVSYLMARLTMEKTINSLVKSKGKMVYAELY